MSDMLFPAWAAVVLERRQCRPETVQRYREWLAHAGALGRLRVRSVKADDIHQVLVDARAAGLGPGSVRAVLTSVRMVLRAGGSRAADGIRVRVPEPARRALTSVEAERLRGVLGVGPEDAALGVLLGTGLRRGEALELRTEDWLADRRVLRLGRTKSGRSREVDVPEWAVRYVLALLAQPRAQARALGRRLTRLCREAGIPRVRVHDLRHTRITHLLLGGAPALYACDQAGHHSPGYTLAVYGHLAAASPAQRRAWAEV